MTGSNGEFGFFLRRLVKRQSCLVVSLLPLATFAAPPDGTNQGLQLRPPHTEISPTLWEQYGLWIILAVVVLAALAAGIIRLVTRPAPPAVIPPAEQARQALAALPPGAADGAALSRISKILRHYVRRAFELPPGEVPTAEFCQMLTQHPKIGLGLAMELGEFLRENDVRKFSAVPPEPPPVPPVTAALALVDKCEARLADLRAIQPEAAGGGAKPA